MDDTEKIESRNLAIQQIRALIRDKANGIWTTAQLEKMLDTVETLSAVSK